MKPYEMIKDQTGAVLVIAAIMLLVLSVIGIYAMGSSIIETKISGQKKFYDAAFNDADGGVAYVRVLNPFGGITSANPPSNPVTYNAPTADYHFTVGVSYLGNSPPPVGSGTGQRAGFRAHHHLIVSTGRDAPQAASNASATLEMEGYRIGF
jgi:hypothetical protein